jgi:hydrogenase maturation protein HypF
MRRSSGIRRYPHIDGTCMPQRARVIRVRGIVQGVGFRPFAYRLAHRFGLAGWVKNGADGVEIHIEGRESDLEAFARALIAEAPPAARIAATSVHDVPPESQAGFEIRESEPQLRPTVRISPDLATCDACVRELFDPADRRYRYPYINCTDCGPRYSIVTGLPYDRPFTTMADWPLCDDCAREYQDPLDRRFHAQPVACPVCGPTYSYVSGGESEARGYPAIVAAAKALREGKIVALKGIGGYLLACDPKNAATVAALRARKYRKERPFALLARDLETALELAAFDPAGAALLASVARPIVLADARVSFEGVAPDNRELGIMLPSTPLHHLLFAAGAPPAIVATSANRSNEPIAYEDEDAFASLDGIADAFLAGERRIARRIDDSVARVTAGSAVVYRFARGYAPAAVTRLPVTRPILALGADLKNAIALAVDGQVFVSQHIGDLEHRSAREACEATIVDLCATYNVALADALVVHDAHPQYISTAIALGLSDTPVAVQHHRAHVASVVAEREAWDEEIVAFAFDGTGFGDDGAIWGGEMFAGSVVAGFTRVAHLRTATLPGGDAAARFPVQAAAGFLAEVDGLPDLRAAPFDFGTRYGDARQLVARNVRCFATTSMGRLFDTVAALLGFTREVTFEAQAALWLEHLAASAPGARPYELAPVDGVFDYRPMLRTIAWDRVHGRTPSEIARAFHGAIVGAVCSGAEGYPGRPVVCSGGVFANRILSEELRAVLGDRVWFNAIVPPNDGGICLGQAALAAMLPRG